MILPSELEAKQRNSDNLTCKEVEGTNFGTITARVLQIHLVLQNLKIGVLSLNHLNLGRNPFRGASPKILCYFFFPEAVNSLLGRCLERSHVFCNSR